MDGMQAMMAQRHSQPHTCTAGVSAAQLTILHLARVDSSPAVHVLLGDVAVWQLKCHVQCSAVAMLDQTVVTNRPGQ